MPIGPDPLPITDVLWETEDRGESRLHAVVQGLEGSLHILDGTGGANVRLARAHGVQCGCDVSFCPHPLLADHIVGTGSKGAVFSSFTQVLPGLWSAHADLGVGFVVNALVLDHVDMAPGIHETYFTMVRYDTVLWLRVAHIRQADRTGPGWCTRCGEMHRLQPYDCVHQMFRPVRATTTPFAEPIDPARLIMAPGRSMARMPEVPGLWFVLDGVRHTGVGLNTPLNLELNVGPVTTVPNSASVRLYYTDIVTEPDGSQRCFTHGGRDCHCVDLAAFLGA